MQLGFGGRQNSSSEDEPDVAAPSQPHASTKDAVDPAELVVTGAASARPQCRT